ncbi:hypothetical protein FE257_003929 [Aspergillus nanangensis]|uniref:NACHT domain-containing protein n=1 Tax=Aspergillus nanangensis TaxID=2582783 RepID=A0AAD4GXD8_ASPNN|nr:hypothetical protein FE257_003929 [Aspergillus nanangensis]
MTFTHDDYTVAWICALPLEMAAAKAMLDEIHSPLAQPVSDHNIYTLGSVSGHNVVVACLPAGVYGTISAAVVVSHLVTTFTNIRFGLMVGIGGGVPRETVDIRLGDVVVSMPTDIRSGIVQYDYGKTLRDRQFQQTGSLNKPPQVLLKAVSQMKSEHIAGKDRVYDVMAKALQKAEIKTLCSRPLNDWLFESTYNHERNKYNCHNCDQNRLVKRTERKTEASYIHYGLIASGDQVMKDAETRDSLARDLHVLSKTRLRRNNTFTTEENECLRSVFLTDPVTDRNALKRKKGEPAIGTCDWILETDELNDWLHHPNLETDVLWIYGNPGTGKSTMAIKITDELPEQAGFSNGQKTLAYFFCDSSSETRRTAVAILRGLIYQLVKQRPSLLRLVLPAYQVRKESLGTSFDALWAILMELGKDTSTEIYCVIDALDECEPESQQTLLDQIYQSLRMDSARSSRVRLLITSRPYPEISEYLLRFNHKDLSSYSAVRKDLETMIKQKVDYLAKRKHYPRKVAEDLSRVLKEKAEGTFLWVGIACEELMRIQSRNAVKTVKKLPSGLYALYQQLLNSALGADDEEKETLLEMLKLVAFARRPLTIPELSAFTQLDTDYDEDSRLQFTKDLVDMCRLMIVVQDQHVQLLHKSVKDFLLKERDEIDDLKTHADLASHCIDHMINTEDEALYISFLNYAVEFWPEHASLARVEFSVTPEDEFFFEFQSRRWMQWLERYNALQQYNYERLSPRFSALHAAARWGITPLASWCLSEGSMSQELEVDTDETTHNGPNFRTRTEVAPLEEAALQGHTAVMRVLLEDADDIGTDFLNRVVQVAAGNEHNGMEMIALLYQQCGQKIETWDVFKAAAHNSGCGKGITKFLLSQIGPDRIHIDDDVLQAALRNRRSGKEILAVLLNREDAEQAQINSEVLQITARVRDYGSDAMTLLLDQLGDDDIQITEDVVKAAAANEESGLDIMRILLDRLGDDEIQITEDVVKAAAENDECGLEILKLLLTRKNQIQLTADILKTAAANNVDGDEVIEFLLDQQEGVEIQITEEVAENAAKNRGAGLQIIELLLDRGLQIPITEDILRSAASNQACGADILELLIDRQGKEIGITDKVVQAAAGNKCRRPAVMALLLDKMGDEIQISEAVIKEAVKNEEAGVNMIALLLDRRGEEIHITKDVLREISKNKWTGDEILTLIYDWIQVTEDVVVQAAGSVQERAMGLLLDRRGDEVQITDDVVESAMANERCGDKLMALLLDRRGEELPVTELAVSMATANKKYGLELIILLLDHRPEVVRATTTVLQTAASAGNEPMLRLICNRFMLLIPSGLLAVARLTDAAYKGHEDDVRELLDKTPPDIADVNGFTPLSWAAANGHIEVVRALLETNKVNINSRDVGGGAPVSWAAAYGHAEVVDLLLESGADPNVVDIDGESAYEVAAHEGYEDIAARLLEAMDSASSISSKSIAESPHDVFPLHSPADQMKLLRVAAPLAGVIETHPLFTISQRTSGRERQCETLLDVD